jgi:hypothetical protein
LKTTRNVRPEQASKQVDTRIVHLEAFARHQAPEHQVQHASDDQVHGWSRERHDDFLGRLLWNPLEPRHATDRQQDHVRRLHAIAPGGKDVAELVQQHAQEQERDEQHARHRRVPSALQVVRGGNPKEEQQKGDVQANHGAFHRADGDRPAHVTLPRTDPFSGAPLINNMGLARPWSL